MINTASVINIPFLHLREGLDELVEGGTRYFHIDLMDGHYVPNLCYPMELIRELKDAYPQVSMDIHVMVEEPIAYVETPEKCGSRLCLLPHGQHFFCAADH